MYPFGFGSDWGGWDGFAAAVGSIIGLAIFVIPWFFFLLTLHKLLERVDPINRAMPPSHVWLNFIPIFHLGWFIYTVYKVRESVKREYQYRAWVPEGDYWFTMGLVAGIAAAFSFVLGWFPFFGWLAPIVFLVCWILYWIKSNEIRNKLGERTHYRYDSGATGPYGPSGPAGPAGGAGYSQPGGYGQQGGYGQPGGYGQRGYGTYPPPAEPQAPQQSTHRQPPAPDVTGAAATAAGAATADATASEFTADDIVTRGTSAVDAIADRPIEYVGDTAGESTSEVEAQTDVAAEVVEGSGFESTPDITEPAGEGTSEAEATRDAVARESGDCAACGTHYDSSDLFCRTCGLKLPD